MEEEDDEEDRVDDSGPFLLLAELSKSMACTVAITVPSGTSSRTKIKQKYSH